jgi:hypothetical protein
MATAQQSADELLRSVEKYQDLYLRSLRGLHEALATNTTAPTSRDARSSEAVFATPPMRPVTLSSPALSNDPTFQTQIQRRRSTLENIERPSRFSLGDTRHFPASIHSISEGDTAIEGDVVFIPLLDLPGSRGVSSEGVPQTQKRQRRCLDQAAFTDDQLLQYLRHTEFTGGTHMAMLELMERRGDMDHSASFQAFAAYEKEPENYVPATCEVYEIDKDNKVELVGPVPETRLTGTGVGHSHSQVVDAPTVWNVIKVTTFQSMTELDLINAQDVNPGGQAVGRMT